MTSLKDTLEQAFGNYNFKPVEIKRADVSFTLYVRTLSGPERQLYDSRLIRKTKKRTEFAFDKQKFLLVAMTLLANKPPDATLMYDSVEHMLAAIKDASVIDEIYAVSGVLNGILDSDDQEDTLGKE